MVARARVVDTSAWIEWLQGTPLGQQLRPQIPARSSCMVPTVVQLELSKWLLHNRAEDQADQLIAYTQKCIVIPLDTAIALLAADIHREYRLAMADAVVYATARQYGADLLTCDAHFKGLPDVLLFPKGA